MISKILSDLSALHGKKADMLAILKEALAGKTMSPSAATETFCEENPEASSDEQLRFELSFLEVVIAAIATRPEEVQEEMLKKLLEGRSEVHLKHIAEALPHLFIGAIVGSAVRDALDKKSSVVIVDESQGEKEEIPPPAASASEAPEGTSGEPETADSSDAVEEPAQQQDNVEPSEEPTGQSGDDDQSSEISVPEVDPSKSLLDGIDTEGIEGDEEAEGPASDDSSAEEIGLADDDDDETRDDRQN